MLTYLLKMAEPNIIRSFIIHLLWAMGGFGMV